MATTILRHRDGSVEIEEIGGGRRRVTARPDDPAAFVPVARCETDYPVPLVEALLEVKSPRFLCDEIRREEDPAYVERDLRCEVLSYVPAGELAGGRALDFGCGAGASTAVLARLAPGVEIVGVDIEERLLCAARLRAAHRRLERASFVLSADPTGVPGGIGDFDVILLSAVYEHLLPAERPVLLPRLWSRLRAGGVLFVNQTPCRFSPVETHTTHLPLLNYLPPAAALRYARRCSPRVSREDTWEDLLRAGIRGGTAGEILRALRRAGGKPRLLEPSAPGIRDRVDIWRAVSTSRRSPAALAALARGMKLWRALTGAVVTPSLALAIRKESAGEEPPAARSAAPAAGGR